MIETWVQNLNRDERTSAIWYGRGSVSGLGLTVHAEWRLGRMNGEASVFSDADEGRLGASIGVPGLLLYVSASSRRIGRVSGWLGSRRLSLCIHDGLLTLYPWSDPMGGWRSDGRWWQQSTSWRLNPADWLLWADVRRFVGRNRADKEEILDDRVVRVGFPEGAVDVRFTRRRRTITRWPFRDLTWDGWRADVDDGIPVPGKGENSWDCDDDAIYSVSFGGDVVRLEDAVGALVASVYRDRLRRGGSEFMEAR